MRSLRPKHSSKKTLSKQKIRVGIVGCGKIFPAHLRAISENRDKFELVAVCDNDTAVIDSLCIEPTISKFIDYENMLLAMTNKMDMVTIATPNSLHFQQAQIALNHQFNVLIEKPVSFTKKDVEKIEEIAIKNSRRAYGVLQVRYNPSVIFLKKCIAGSYFGKIRSISLIQRWQRPTEYFSDWRGDINIGGRTLYEVGIHYLDIMRWIFGNPKVLYTKTFQLKHKDISFEDTVYSTLEFSNHCAGTIEVTIAAEPCNLECSLTLIGEKGMMKLGGKALNNIERIEISDSKLSNDLKTQASIINENLFNDYGSYQGSSPNHPKLYKQLSEGRGILIQDIAKSISFIEEIYHAEQK